MKTTRKSTNEVEGRGYSFMYKDIPGDGEKNARIEEWENGEGADVWLFMGVILIIFAMIFKKGIEIQSENDLTV